MFYSVGTLLSPLQFLLALASSMFRIADDDEADKGNPDSEEGDAGEQDDPEDEDPEGDPDPEEDPEEDPEDDDLNEDLDDEEKTRRNADTAISEKDRQVESSLMSLVKTMTKFPDTAEDTIKDLQKEQPDLAKRLAKMYEGQKNEKLNAALKDAPESVRTLLSTLVEEVGSLKSASQNEQIQRERRLYKEWEGASHPYLNPKSDKGNTPMGKKLIKEFHAAVNRMPESEPLTPDLLEDALAIAKRRSGWNDSSVSEQVKKQAKEQAQKARAGAAGSGKSKKGGSGEEATPSEITRTWPTASKDRLKRVEEIKKKKGFK